MKTTFDLPADLVRDLKLRAVHEGRKMKELAASLLATGLASESAGVKIPRPRREAIKLPLFRCAPDAPAQRMSMTEIAALEQKIQTHEDLERLGFSF